MLNVLFSSKPLRYLTVFGIGFPLGVIELCTESRRNNWAALQLIEWTTIVAGFWFIAGMLVTGICLIRDGLRRPD